MQTIFAVNSTAHEVAPAIFLCLCVWVPIFICMGFSFWISVRDGIAHLKRLHQIPCDRCAFFTGTHNLKCTVHPLSAFTEEAIDCRDFEQRQSPRPACASSACAKKGKRWFRPSLKSAAPQYELEIR
jgi:hypothetical protein